MKRRIEITSEEWICDQIIESIGKDFNLEKNEIEVSDQEVYTYDDIILEGNEEIKQKVLENLYDINVNYDWWEFSCEDAERIELKITGFDIDRESFCELDFICSADDTAKLILEEHGETCDTHKLASSFLEDFRVLTKDVADLEEQHEIAYKNDDKDEGELWDQFKEKENDLEELCDEFKSDLSHAYLTILRNEYEYLTSEEAILESIQANAYEFNKYGRII